MDMGAVRISDDHKRLFVWRVWIGTGLSLVEEVQDRLLTTLPQAEDFL